jgi:hypothetical protein
VKAAIHATGAPHKFEECANPPFYALAHQDGKSRYVHERMLHGRRDRSVRRQVLRNRRCVW